MEIIVKELYVWSILKLVTVCSAIFLFRNVVLQILNNYQLLNIEILIRPHCLLFFNLNVI